MKTIAQIESYEAKIQRAMASIKKLGDGVYSVASESESAPHVLTTANDQVTYCTCKGWNVMVRGRIGAGSPSL